MSVRDLAANSPQVPGIPLGAVSERPLHLKGRFRANRF